MVHNASLTTSTTRMAATAAKTSLTGRWHRFRAHYSDQSQSPSGTSSSTSTASSTTLRLPRTISGQPQARSAPHSLCARFPCVRRGGRPPGHDSTSGTKSSRNTSLERTKRRTCRSTGASRRCGSPRTRRSCAITSFLTLDGIPAAAFGYRLGNRSALEWVIDQYRVKTDKRSEIVNDPNRGDDPEYIVRLIGKVISVSLETVEIVEGLPELGVGEEGGSRSYHQDSTPVNSLK